jgi:hydroxyacyl-ACP dehydratase HTD2-like protein with hotdog domain
MVDLAAIGNLGEPFDMVVESGKIREFARATLSRNPDYFDDPVAVSPTTFLMTSAFWNTTGTMPTLGLDLDLARLLHGGQEFTFHGPPPRAGTRLTGQMRVADAYEKEGRRGGTLSFVEVVTDFHDPAGTLVAESKTVLVVTGKLPTEDA